MHTLALFNHKGGVGKTTIVVNVTDALVDLGMRVLMVDADPQCNLTSFFLTEEELDGLLGESDDVDGGTIWSAIKPVVDGKGPIKEIETRRLAKGMFLCPGDVLLADYEEALPGAWTGSFARKTRDYDVMCALSKAVRAMGKKHDVDLVVYDVGPNVGPLNRTETVRQLAPDAERKKLLHGKPVYLGYITSAYKVASGRSATRPHEYWEAKIAPRVRDRIIQDLRQVDPALVPHGSNKLGAIKNFHSLAPQAQEKGLAIGSLIGHVNPGYYEQVREAASEFQALAREIMKRLDAKTS